MCNVYLIHLDTPIKHAKHYLGYTASEDITTRFLRHKSGNGARLLQVANQLGITYQIVKTWNCKNPQTARALEKRLKKQHNSPKLCPICNKKEAKNENRNDVVFGRF